VGGGGCVLGGCGGFFLFGLEGRRGACLGGWVFGGRCWREVLAFGEFFLGFVSLMGVGCAGVAFFFLFYESWGCGGGV